jgi:hypothetical protein
MKFERENCHVLFLAVEWGSSDRRELVAIAFLGRSFDLERRRRRTGQPKRSRDVRARSSGTHLRFDRIEPRFVVCNKTCQNNGPRISPD